LYLAGQSIRAIDGSNNNTITPQWGMVGDDLFELTSPAFGNNVSSITGTTRPNPRFISNELFDQSELIFDDQNFSDFLWVFGQFLDHDLVLVESDLSEPLAIVIPEDDIVFSPEGPPIRMFRSREVIGTGNSVDNARKYANEVTGYLDGSAVYGSSNSRASWLRSFEDGKLKMSSNQLLPWNTTTGEFNAPRNATAPFMDDPIRVSAKHFVAGDIRANENPLLLTIHILFAREHNRLCDALKLEHPDWTDELLYQRARKMVGGMIQSVTYNEWLPAIGIQLPAYNGYRADVNAQISNVFSAAAFRFGHTLINSNILRLDSDGEELASGHISLREAFFNPLVLDLAGGIEPYLRGMATQTQQKLDCSIVDDVRNFLFETPTQGGLDLAAININRGRDRGLADFNSLRSNLGLPTVKSFSALTNDSDLAELLQEIYNDIDDLDPWVGMLAEDYMPESMMGNTLIVILEEQFRRLRDGDKFYYQNDPELTIQQKAQIRQTTLRDIIMRNSSIAVMQDDVFKAEARANIPLGPAVDEIDLAAIAYPNPTSGAFDLQIYSEIDQEVMINIYDLQGKKVLNQAAILSNGDNTLAFDLSRFSGDSQYFNIVIMKEDKFTVLRVFKL